jgi:hypothetical protein
MYTRNYLLGSSLSPKCIEVCFFSQEHKLHEYRVSSVLHISLFLTPAIVPGIVEDNIYFLNKLLLLIFTSILLLFLFTDEETGA